MTFRNWLDTFISEKRLDLETVFTVAGPVYGENHIPLAIVVDAIKQAPANEQVGIKSMLVRLDFANADCLDYFRHLAAAIAI